jgi:hypothetical protein
VVDDGISFLLDNAFLGKDTGSPFEWNITTAALAGSKRSRLVGHTRTRSGRMVVGTPGV